MGGLTLHCSEFSPHISSAKNKTKKYLKNEKNPLTFTTPFSFYRIELWIFTIYDIDS
jgi:hypothetical protein